MASKIMRLDFPRYKSLYIVVNKNQKEAVLVMADLASDTSILIVEDDEHIAYILEFLLTREGFAMQHAADGRGVALGWI